MSNVSFQDQAVVITGAGRGMGRAYALEFAKRGASVVVNDIEERFALEVVREIVNAGGTAVPACVSVSTPEGGAEIIAVAQDHFRRVDVVVANAGYLDVEHFGAMSRAQIIDNHATQLLGSCWVAQPAWRIMESRGYGRIVFIGSSTGLFGQYGNANYGASKAGIWGLMKALACEAEGTDIRVNLVMPSGNTTIGEATAAKLAARGQDMGAFMFGAAAEVFNALWEDPIRLEPWMNAPLVTYLASKECTVNGEGFSSVAGRYARVFVGIADGWTAEDVTTLRTESIRDHFEEIRDLGSFSVPKYTADEMAGVVRSLQALPAASSAGHES